MKPAYSKGKASRIRRFFSDKSVYVLNQAALASGRVDGSDNCRIEYTGGDTYQRLAGMGSIDLPARVFGHRLDQSQVWRWQRQDRGVLRFCSRHSRILVFR